MLGRARARCCLPWLIRSSKEKTLLPTVLNYDSGVHRRPFADSNAPSDLLEQPTHEDVVAGARVAWADDSTLGLHRRAILSFQDGGPRSVLVVKKPDDPIATAKLQELSEWLQKQGIEVYVERQVLRELPHLRAYQPSLAAIRGTVSGEAAGLTANDHADEVHHFRTTQVDLCITLGGDGTVLHLASLFSDDRCPLPPVVSFAMGTLGFLTPFSASESVETLSSLLSPADPSSLIHCTLLTRRQCEVHWAGTRQRVYSVLNECLLDRGASPAMILVEVLVDGRHVTTVQADGLIVAPPSGSTAYSMSAGGPMVAPSVPCTLITPVAPHSLSFRPLIIPENSVVELHLPANSRAQARASFDGRHAMQMPRDSSIICRASRYALPMINRQALDADWYEGITQKLRWTGSLRPLTHL